MASGNKNKPAKPDAKANAPTSATPPESAEQKRGPGRPPGSPNVDYDICVTLPPKCRKCGSTEFGPRQHVKTRKHNGTVGGHAYNTVSNYRCRCANPKCNQATFLAVYRMVPPASEEAGFDEPGDSDSDAAGDELIEDDDDALDLDDILAEETAGT